MRVEAINHAIRDMPEELVRLHICWGSSHHPHTQDIPLSDIIDIVLKVKAQCYQHRGGEPAARARVGACSRTSSCRTARSSCPGVLGHARREFVEHPELVAQRLLRYAELVGNENVIAGTDCGLQRVRARQHPVGEVPRHARRGGDGVEGALGA